MIGELHQAANGNEALSILTDHWIDLVITDYNMPDMDGLTLLKTMKDNDLTSPIPVVMVTTEGSSQRVDEFMAAGAVGYIKKPFTPEVIREKLNTILGKTENEQIQTDDSDQEFDF